MTQIILSGANGRMGRVIAELVASKYSTCRILYGIDIAPGEPTGSFPVYPSPDAVPRDMQRGDVIIDFSHLSAVRPLLAFAAAHAIPAVIATTGIAPQDAAYIEEVSAKIPVFRSANMSIGICLVKNLIRRAADFLGDDFDIEIVERHHNQKLDAPSGTALALADAISESGSGKYHYIYDRHSRSARRSRNEIGISSVRGGSIVGDHEVIFAGNNEVIEISHKAISRNIFADGAIRAALFLKDQKPGMYSMDSLL